MSALLLGIPCSPFLVSALRVVGSEFFLECTMIVKRASSQAGGCLQFSSYGEVLEEVASPYSSKSHWLWMAVLVYGRANAYLIVTASSLFCVRTNFIGCPAVAV